MTTQRTPLCDRRVRTSADGGFTFSDVPSGAYSLDVRRNGFANSSCHNRGCGQITLKSGQTLDDIVLRLTPAGVIAGQVLDEDQEPVAGLQVYALRVNFLSGGRRQTSAIASAVTDDQGSFRIPSLQPRFYYLRAGGLIVSPMNQVALKEGPGGNLQYRDTYYPGTARLDEAQPVEVSPYVETNGLRFSVPTKKAYTVTGSLVSRGKRTGPRPTDIVVLKRNEAEQMFGFSGAALFPDGTFKISGLSPGEYTLSAMATTNGGEISEGYTSVRIVDSDVHANLQVGQAAEVRGRVEAPAGVPLAGLQIILQTNGGSYHPSAIDPSGHFDIVNLPPGDYTVLLTERNATAEPAYIKSALCSGKDYTSEPLVLGVSTVLDCELTVANDTGVVSGQVTDDDKSAAGFVALLIPEASELRRLPRYTQTGKTDVSGHFRIMGVIPGDYLLFAVPTSEDHVYFALDFADRNQANAEHVRVDARATRVVNLRVFRTH